MVQIAPSRNYATTTNSSRVRDNAVYIGFIKKNDDAQRMGRVSVWIPEIGGDQTKPESWIIVGYVTPFGGATNPDNISKQNTTAAGTQRSYGMWAQPPDLENQVLVAFVNGDVAQGYMIGCIFQQNMNHMVPGLASNTTNDSQAKADGVLPPVVEYNKQNTTSTASPARAPFAPLADGLKTVGIQKDYERGPSSSSARREAPSKVFGVSSPGGNSFVMDDLDGNSFIRLRTPSGAQVLIHESTGYIYINSKGGNAWIEISDSGIDIYSKNSVSIRAEADFNVRADGNIILDAGSAINMRAGTDITMEAGKSLQLATGTDIVASAGGKLALTSTGNFQVKSGVGVLLQSAASTSLKAGSTLITESGAVTSMKAAGVFLRNASQIIDNGGGGLSATAVPDSIPQGPQGKKAYDVQGGKGTTKDTIASRMPSHEPWTGHPKPNLPPPSAPASLSDIAGHPGQGSETPAAGGTQTKSVMTGDGPTNVTLNNDGQRCALGVGTKTASTQVYNAIQTVSDQKGVNFGTMMAMADVESGFNPNAAAGNSSAKGNYQFLDSTWSSMVSKYGAADNVSTDPSEKFDPTSNAKMGANYMLDNQKLLQSKGISDPSTGQLYMLHMLGGSGGPKFIAANQADPNQPLSNVLPANVIAGNPLWFKGQTTVGDAYNKIDGTMNAKASAYNKQAGLPAPCDRDSATASNTSSSGASSTGSPSSVGDKHDDTPDSTNVSTSDNPVTSPIYGGDPGSV